MNKICFAICLYFFQISYVSASIPECRFDNTLIDQVETSLDRILTVTEILGIKVPFTSFEINKKINDESKGILRVEIIKDGYPEVLDENGCLKENIVILGNKLKIDGDCVPGGLKKCKRKSKKRMKADYEKLRRFGMTGDCYLTNLHACDSNEMRALLDLGKARDSHSVKGTCHVSFTEFWSLKCSAGAIKILLTELASSGIESPALVYVLAHEVFHIIEKTESKFSSTGKYVDLSWSIEKKLKYLQKSCRLRDAFSASEEKADNYALRILVFSIPSLKKKLELPPHMSQYYIIDQIGYAASYLGQWTAFWNDDPDVLHHDSLNVTNIELPATKETIQNKTESYLCATSKKSKGRWTTPLIHGNSHPPLPQRMQKISKNLSKYLGNSDMKNSDLNGLQSVTSKLLITVDEYVAKYYSDLTEKICDTVMTNKLCEE